MSRLEQRRKLLLPQVNAGVPEADPSEHAGQVHAGARLQVLGVAHSPGRRRESAAGSGPRPSEPLPFHELGHHPEGVAGPHVTDGVAALVGGAGQGVGGAGAPLVVGEGGVRLQGVAERRKQAFTANMPLILKGADRKLTRARQSRC